MQQLTSKLNHYLARLDHAERQVKDETEQLTKAETYVNDVAQAQVLVQTVAEQIQTVAHKRVASIVTRCLHAVFGKTYNFKIEFKKSRGKTEAELKLTKGDLELDPLDSTGGGVVDTVSMALRLASLVLSRPQKRKLLVLDEPFKMISRNYSSRVRNMLLVLAEELGFQIIMVTHNKKLAIGKVVEIE